MHYQRWYKYGDPLKRFKGHELHGLRGIPEYEVWHAMKDRCFNPKQKYYCNYGGRGIGVCERWRHSFKNFYEDMGPRPFPKAQIDRIDNDGDYEPGNCHWVSRAENMRNRKELPRDSNGRWKKRDLEVKGK